ncbi:hypothetical protein FisN_2Hh390 [Fistulifera solaris]|uniref:DUF676 domain-containing protein n=1 Tax=Fistulifera solaris TaxID=1519565 RepID=A0A1Z5KKS0_FISSO|nr:hypothetical protein FisN_2Hh390 [Fistulifera solaris]|eukprot:GAX26672.1 hypothetical protein FisN_2Hh390 [Fistulifera solaris]
MDTFLLSWYQTDSINAVCSNNIAIMVFLLLLGLYMGTSHSVTGMTWFSQFVLTKSQQRVSILRSSTLSSEDWWKDLAPPFSLVDEEDENDEDDVYASTGEDDEEDSDFSESSEFSSPEQRPTVTHFCFLVHGHRGYSRDLSYLQHKMERVAKEVKRKRKRERIKRMSNLTAGERAAEVESAVHELVVHAVVCNERKTDDGVANGGERLVEEMITTIREEMSKRRPFASPDNLQNVTISIIGNSLGGIYSRYAIAKLSAWCNPKNNTSSVLILDGKYALHFNVFCTTATPHLGIAGHTFLPIPRTAEIGVAHALGETGRDLFRVNDLLKRMATTDEFLRPLRAFRKRIAYANAYATDFPVPVRTAAFLSESSSYPHHFVEEGDDADKLVVDDNGLVIATLHTPAQHLVDKDFNHSVSDDENDDLVEMSRSLDSLGWKKVFIDVRNMIPSISLPSVPKISLPTVLIRKNRTASTDESDTLETVEQEDKENVTSGSERQSDPVNLLKQKGNVVSSSDLAAALSTHPLFGEEILRWPRGHNMIVAFSRDPVSTYLNKAGRPVVNSLATELVDTIFGWNQSEVTEQFKTQC